MFLKLLLWNGQLGVPLEGVSWIYQLITDICRESCSCCSWKCISSIYSWWKYLEGLEDLIALYCPQFKNGEEVVMYFVFIIDLNMEIHLQLLLKYKYSLFSWPIKILAFDCCKQKKLLFT